VMPGSRAAVAAELNALSATGHALNTDANHCTDTMYKSDSGRRHFRKGVVNKYLALSSPQVGRLAIVTAGPPGAGKTTLLHAQVYNVAAAYRILDADIVKDDLIEQALSDGIYNHLLARQLVDGYPISPRELAPLVHRESTVLIAQIRQICVASGENVVIEGTLTYPPQGPQIFGELAKSKYTSVEVFSVEIDQATAHAQALSRWWDGRAGSAVRIGLAVASCHPISSTGAIQGQRRSMYRECAQHDQSCTVRCHSKPACQGFRS
jgi:hypothetical protein